MRALINAFAFSPYRGSECAVGWNVARALAQRNDVVVICGDIVSSKATQSELIRYFGEGKRNWRIENTRGSLEIVYVAPSRFTTLLERMHHLPGMWFLYYLAYNLWQREAYRVARQLVADCPFDVVHHLNMIGYREPGYMWKLPIPFVWGPVGGGPNEPIAYHTLFSWSGCVKVFLRTVCNEIQKRICWRAREAANRAVKVWAVTEADYRMIHNIWGVECEKMVETGTILRPEGYVRRWEGKELLHIVWSGIHTSRKALPILILALQKLASTECKEWSGCLDMSARVVVDVLGEGPETGNWKRLAERSGVARCLKWHGRLPHDQALTVMNAGHVFVFPSLKEGTPHVVLEALSLGLPVICHDACGMGTVVTESCGIKIPLKNPEMSIAGFATALKQVLCNPKVIGHLSRGALERARCLSWEAKAESIEKGYREAVL